MNNEGCDTLLLFWRPFLCNWTDSEEIRRLFSFFFNYQKTNLIRHLRLSYISVSFVNNLLINVKWNKQTIIRYMTCRKLKLSTPTPKIFSNLMKYGNNLYMCRFTHHNELVTTLQTGFSFLSLNKSTNFKMIL